MVLSKARSPGQGILLPRSKRDDLILYTPLEARSMKFSQPQLHPEGHQEGHPEDIQKVIQLLV